MIKDIVVNLSVGADSDPARDYAISVASTFGAHIAAIAFAYEPIAPPVFGLAEVMTPEWFNSQRSKAENTAKAAIATFQDGVQRAGPSAESHLLNAPIAEAAGLFARIARRYDLSVVRQNDPGKLAYEDLIIEAALFESGRPVLIVPYIQSGGLVLDRVMICWDGSRNAARAIADAMPFLTRAKAIELVMVGTDIKQDEISGADIAHHLARHGLKIDIKRIVAPDVDVPNTILSHAADISTDLIIMGAYGHSRLREFILGGATRGILATMTVPTLMSH